MRDVCKIHMSLRYVRKSEIGGFQIPLGCLPLLHCFIPRAAKGIAPQDSKELE